MAMPACPLRHGCWKTHVIFQDMLQVALIINTFIRRSNVVMIAAIAQLANVNALSMTQPDGPA